MHRTVSHALKTIALATSLAAISACSQTEPGCDPRKMRSFIQCAKAKKTSGYSADRMTTFLESNGFDKMGVYQDHSRWMIRYSKDGSNRTIIAVIETDPHGRIDTLTFK